MTTPGFRGADVDALSRLRSSLDAPATTLDSLRTTTAGRLEDFSRQGQDARSTAAVGEGPVLQPVRRRTRVHPRQHRLASSRPSSRELTNLARHLPTVGSATLSCAATWVLFKPLAQASTIRDLNANACDDFLRLAHRTNCSDSSNVNSSSAFRHPLGMTSYYQIGS